MGQHVPNSVFLHPVTGGEVSRLVSALKDKYCHTSSYPNKILKLLTNLISPTLANIKNKLFHEGCFPQSLNVARVVLIHKVGEVRDVGNYSPISVLSALSKIFERAMYNRIYTFFIANKVSSAS